MSVVSTESRGKYEDERKHAGAAKMAEERKAATNAKAILSWLTPSNARTDRLTVSSFCVMRQTLRRPQL